MSQTIKTMKSFGTFSTTSTGMSFTITKPLEELTKMEMTAFKNYAPIAWGHVSVLGKIFQGGIIALNVGFIVWVTLVNWSTVVTLVQNWTNKHPAVQVIDDVLRKLDDLEKHFKNE